MGHKDKVTEVVGTLLEGENNPQRLSLAVLPIAQKFDIGEMPTPEVDGCAHGLKRKHPRLPKALSRILCKFFLGNFP